MTSIARHRPLRPLFGTALLLLGVSASGCGVLSLGHRDQHPAPPPTAHAANARVKPKQSRKAAKAAKAAPVAEAKRTPRGSAADMAQQLALAPAEPYWPYRIGIRLADADSAAFAEEWYQLALARDAHYAPALAALSNLWFTQGRHEEAIRLLEGARTNAAAFPDGFPPALAASLALHYDAVDRVADARQLMDAVPRSGREDALGANVFLTLRGEKPEEAEAIAKESAHDHPKSAASQNNYGITRLRKGDVDDARKAFQKAIALDPALAGPYYNLAILEKFYAFDDAAAAGWFRQYRERATTDPDGLAQVLAAPAAGEIAKKGDR